MVRRIVRWSIIIVMLFAVFPAVAQTNSSAPGAGSGGKLRAACGEDLQRFCAGVPPVGGASFNVYRPMLVSCWQRAGIWSPQRAAAAPNSARLVVRTCSGFAPPCNLVGDASFNV